MNHLTEFQLNKTRTLVIQPLPSHVNILEILTNIAKKPLNSQETKELCCNLSFEKDEISAILHVSLLCMDGAGKNCSETSS